ncbi:MAG: molybdopterin biosynthesis protein [Desulfobacterium sp.]|nr:molybdopterin biosynthesis protein [Desulfobacterium sp.]
MALKRNIYLEMKSIQEAKKIIFDKSPVMPSMDVETIASVESGGRVLAEPAVASLSSPNFHAAAMDGIAVAASVTFGATPEVPIILKPGVDAFWVNTGHIMPDGTNAVIMIENLNILDDKGVEIEAPLFPWQNVRKMGEDIVATELLFPRGHTVTAYSIGALVSGGVFSVCVRKRPNVMIIPTGNELKQWEDIDKSGMMPGDVIDSNSHVLAALCRDNGATSVCHTLLEDNLGTMTAAVKEAVVKGIDMILIIGGSSAGSEDFARPIVQALGEIHLHGVTMMPGKPILFGTVEGKPVFGIPGYPVSAIVAFEEFVGPLLAAMQGLYRPDREKAMVLPGRKMASKLGQEEFVRVKIGSVDDRLVASQLPRGAGSITTLTRADGVIRIPADTEGIQEGVAVEAQLLRPRSAIEKTIVITGSHDNTLDVLADQIRRNSNEVSISSTHVGSMGGLMAIKRGTCHMAGSHLLDPEDGSYNLSYIKRYLPDESVWVVNLVMRDQGLIVAKENPKNIKGLEDLKATDLTFINRQPGSGTRVLLDYKLDTLGIPSRDIKGYSSEEYTHMSVAAAVLSGRADAGLGIHAAAKALGLDFIPVVTEEYDLIIPDRFFTTDKVQVLIETIRSDAFKDRVMALGGYDTEKTGEIIFH